VGDGLPRRALVIEDERRLAENIARGLQQGAGFAVDISANGEEGLYNATGSIYDVIVLDLMLPRLSREEVVHRLQRQLHFVPYGRLKKEGIV
jgi:DNA-binding response OmpR family regulator